MLTAAVSDKAIVLKHLPRSLHAAVKQQALDQDTTSQVIVLRALKEAGLPVPDELLQPRRQGRRPALLAMEAASAEEPGDEER